MTHDEAALLVPDLGRGRLDAQEEAAVRAHLTGCTECSGLADAYRLVTVALRVPPEHPDTADLVAHAMGAARPDVAGHLGACPSCSQQVAAIRTAESELGTRHMPLRTWAARAAVVALPLFAGYVGWVHLRVLPDMREAVAQAEQGGPAAETLALPLLSPALRGGEEPVAVPVAAGQQSIAIAVAPALPRDLADAEVLRVEVRDPGDLVVFTREMTAGEMRRLSGTSGAFALVVPASLLPAGDARLTVQSDSHGELLAAPFRVRRE